MWQITVVLLLGLLVQGCAPSAGGEVYPVAGRALAGPTCPVVTEPANPACADDPVAGAVVVVLDHEGREVARTTTGAEGRFALSLPAGNYVLVPQPADGVMGTAPPLRISVADDDPALLSLVVTYDTGIR